MFQNLSSFLSVLKQKILYLHYSSNQTETSRIHSFQDLRVVFDRKPPFINLTEDRLNEQ